MEKLREIVDRNSAGEGQPMGSETSRDTDLPLKLLLALLHDAPGGRLTVSKTAADWVASQEGQECGFTTEGHGSHLILRLVRPQEN